MEICRLCNQPMRPGQKAWRLGTDVEHEQCGHGGLGARPVEAYITTLRAAVRGLNGVRADLVALGRELVLHHMHRKPDGRATAQPIDVEEHLRGAADRLREVVKLLARRD